LIGNNDGILINAFITNIISSKNPIYEKKNEREIFHLHNKSKRILF